LTNLDEFLEKNSRTRKGTAQIFGSAPTVKIAKKVKKKSTKFAVGDMPWRAPNLGPYDFWITNNTYFPLPWRNKDLKKLIKSKSKVFISSSSVNNLNENEKIEDVLETLKVLQDSYQFVYYDTNHFSDPKKKHINNNCCGFTLKFKTGKPIQEKLSEFLGESGESYDIGHATINAIALALMLNFEEIYIHGVELPENMGNYKYYKNWKFALPDFKLRITILIQQYIFRSMKSDFGNENQIKFLQDFEKVGLIAKGLKTPIFVSSRTSPLLQLPGYQYLDLKT
jgi:hypothetical protein